MRRQLDERLGDVVARRLLQLGGVGVDLLAGGEGPHQHVVAAGVAGGLHHQRGQIVAHEREVVLAQAHVGGDLAQERVLAEVVLDERRHVGVDRLVVGHAGARRVGDGHVALAVDVHETRHPEQAGALERQRVEEILVHAAVDDVHALAAAGGPHVEVAVFHDEVAPFHQEHAHLAGEERVLEVGGVVDAGREHDRDRILGGPRRRPQQRVEEQTGIVTDGAHRVAGEELGKYTMQEIAVLQHVRHAARAAAVVLQDEELTAIVADDVGADHVGVDLPGRRHPQELALVLLAREHQLGRDHLVLETLLFLIDVGDEQIERGHALDEPGLDALPLARRDDARHEVEREDALETVLLAVHGEGDALVDQRDLLQSLPPGDLGERERFERGHQGPVVRARRGRPIEGLVVGGSLGHPFHSAPA